MFYKKEENYSKKYDKYKIKKLTTGGSGTKRKESHRPVSICDKRVITLVLPNIRICLPKLHF
jgi:hypothetical protein